MLLAELISHFARGCEASLMRPVRQVRLHVIHGSSLKLSRKTTLYMEITNLTRGKAHVLRRVCRRFLCFQLYILLTLGSPFHIMDEALSEPQVRTVPNRCGQARHKTLNRDALPVSALASATISLPKQGQHNCAGIPVDLVISSMLRSFAHLGV